MKKLLVICLTIAMALSMSVSVLADDPGAAAPEGSPFVSSPSVSPAPEVISFSVPNTTPIVKAYSERDDLKPEDKAQFEKAYHDLTAAAADLTAVNEDLKQTVEEKKLSADDLAVSALFYIECEVGGTIKLKPENLDKDKFVALLHMLKDGNWEMVKDAKVTDDGELEFTVDSFSPFAIVERKTAEPAEPAHNAMIGVYIAIAVVAAAAIAVIIVVVVKNKKQTQQTE